MRWALALPTERVPAVYEPRQPRKTALYQLVEAHYEDVKALWEDRFEKLYGRYFGAYSSKARAYRKKRSFILTSLGTTHTLASKDGPKLSPKKRAALQKVGLTH